MQTVPHEFIYQFKFCMVCGTEITFGKNFELFNEDSKEPFIYLRCNKCKTESRIEDAPPKTKASENSPCKKCHGNVVIAKVRHKGNRHLLKPYYFTHYLRCQKCGTMYMDDRFKIINE